MMDQPVSPVFDVFPVGGGPYTDVVVSDLYYTPSARGVALFVVGDPANPVGKYFVHLVAVDMTSGKFLSGKGTQIDFNTDQAQLLAFYPLAMAAAPSVFDVQTTLPVYWRVGVVPPDAGEYAMTMGAQLLI